MTDKNLTLKLNVSAKAVKETFRGLSDDVKKIVGGTAKWKEALQGVTNELKGGRQNVAKMQAQMLPENLGKRVRLQLAQEDAGKQLQEATVKERQRQYAPRTWAGKLGKQMGFDVTPGNKGTQSMLGGVTKALGMGDELAGLFGGVTKALGPVGAVIGGITMAVGMLKGMVQKFIGEVTKYVQVANPGAVKRFNMAMEDATAVIGHSLTPVMELFTKGARLLGDTLASILPSSDQMRQALAPLDASMKDLRKSLQDIAPLIREVLVDQMRQAAFWLKMFADQMRVMMLVIKWTTPPWMQNGGPLKDSTGAAARSHVIQDSDSYAKSIYTAIAGGQGKKPEERTADNTGKIVDLLRESFTKWFDGMRALLDGSWFDGPGEKIGDSIRNGWESLKDSFKLPEFKFPELNFPELKLPDFKLPELAFPDLAGPLTDAANRIPEAIKSALTELPQKIADAIKNSLPALPSLPNLPALPSNPIGDAARRARENWNNFNPFG